MSKTIQLASLLLALFSLQAVAGAPVVDAPLEPLSIAERGELLLDGDEITYTPWSSDTVSGKVHIIQYMAATKSASETYKPFTDLLASTFESGTLQVSSIINLKAAMWGTGGFVMSEVKKNKRAHPEATMVMDKKGAGTAAWDLDKKGSALVILNKAGTVVFYTNQGLEPGQEVELITLVKALQGG